MAVFDVTQPNATREGDEIVLRVKAPGGFVQLRIQPNDVLEMIQQLQRALAMPNKTVPK